MQAHACTAFQSAIPLRSFGLRVSGAGCSFGAGAIFIAPVSPAGFTGVAEP
jgi:hypothetical protein